MLAHLVQTGFGAFYDGIAHWAMSPRDLMVVVAMALFAGLGGRGAARVAVIGLPVGWLVAGVVGFQLPAVGELPLLTSITVGTVGVLVALNKQAPLATVAVLAAVCGGLHGLANGSVMVVENRELLTLFGAVAAVVMVMLLGSAIVVSIRKPVAVIVFRVAGSWLAAIALLLLGWQLRRGR